MASGSTGAPWNIPFPRGADNYALTGDLQTMASQTAVNLSNAVDEASWDRGTRVAPIDALTAKPGTYEFPSAVAAQGITPALPAEAAFGGTLEIGAGGFYRTITFTPIGTPERPKPVWRNEYNAGLGGWYGWHRVAPRTSQQRTDLVTVIGDSQSEAAVDGSWDEFAAPLITQSFDNQARSGDDTTAIGIRTGWIEPLVTVAGGQIPASGSVVLQSAGTLPTRENRVLTTGTIAGVAGSLRYDTAGQFTFTRSTAGDAVTVTGPTRFTTSYHSDAGAMLIWMGGNDFNYGFTGAEGTVAEHVIAGYRRALEWARGLGYDVAVAGVTNRLAAGPGTDGFAQVQQVNDTLARMFPGRFLDVQGYYSQHALADAGLTPTTADTEAMEAGAIPPQLFLADGVHLTTAAHGAIGENFIAPWLVAQGLATATGSIPALKPLPSRSQDVDDWSAAITALNAAAT